MEMEMGEKDKEIFTEIMRVEFLSCKGCDHYNEDCYDILGLCYRYDKYTNTKD